MWRVVFQTANEKWIVPVKEKSAADANAVVALFRATLRRRMELGGCRGFTVTVHPDGPDCDHEAS